MTEQMQSYIVDACKKHGSLGGMSKNLQKAIIANIEKECDGIPSRENLDYSHTYNERIRLIYSATRTLSDEELNEIKTKPEEFAEYVYGPNTHAGKMLGNTKVGEAYKYRGAGLIQLTGFFNFEKYGRLAGVSLLDNPDLLVTDLELSAKVAVVYVIDRLKASNEPIPLTQDDANRAVTKAVQGANLDLSKGYGAEVLAKVTKFADQVVLA